MTDILDIETLGYEVLEKALKDYKHILLTGTSVLTRSKNGNISIQIEKKEKLRDFLINSEISNYYIEDTEAFIIDFEKRCEDERHKKAKHKRTTSKHTNTGENR